jgi:hypothetical protein
MTIINTRHHESANNTLLQTESFRNGNSGTGERAAYTMDVQFEKEQSSKNVCDRTAEWRV